MEDSAIRPFVEDLALYASIASVPSLIVTYLAWIRKPGIGRTVILVFAASATMAAYTVDVSDRLGLIKWSETGDLITAYGQQDKAFFMAVNSGHLLRYKDKFKMMVIIEVPYTTIDRMTDTYIEKSTEVTITGDQLIIGMTLPSLPNLRFNIPANIKSGDFIYPHMDFNLVIIPNNLSAAQIRSLSDVEQLGGKVVATRFNTVQFTVETKPAG